MDWNTFFSALSQSAAAIVGIFGAFLLSKTLNNQSTFIEKRNKIKNILADCQNIDAEAGSLPFERYNLNTNDRLRNALYEKFKDDLQGAQTADPRELYYELDNSLFQTEETTINLIKSTLFEIVEKLEGARAAEKEAERRQEEEDQIIKNLRDSNSPLDRLKGLSRLTASASAQLSTYSPFSYSPFAFDYAEINHALIEEDYDAIDQVVRKIEHQCLIVENFLETITGNPESSAQITWATILTTLLFFIGVIYPVSFMPVPQGTTEIHISISAFIPALLSFKGALLSVVSGFFLAIPATFIYLNNSLKYDPNEIERLARYTNPANYSEFLGLY